MEKELREYLENKIKGCEELEMYAEKWAFIQCLLELNKLRALAEKPTSEPAKALGLLGVVHSCSNCGSELTFKEIESNCCSDCDSRIF